MKRTSLPLLLLILSLAGCNNQSAPLTATRTPSETERPAAITATVSQVVEPSCTPLPSATASPTPLPSPTARQYDRFISQLTAQEVQVFYSPAVVGIGQTLTAIIALPLQTPGSIEQPFSGLYEVTVEVYTHGADEFEPGQPTGAQYTFKGKEIDGERQDGAMLLTWHDPVYNSSLPFVYRFTIYSLTEGNALGEVILSGLPDPATQVTFQDWPTAEPQTELAPDATPTYDPFPDVQDSGRND